MEETDKILIERLVREGDANAFAALMGQYADMVYGTCRRVLGSDAQAADVAQETFFHFLKSADRITGSLGCWLHRVATRRAVDAVRQDVSRRRREETYAASALHEVESWEEIEPLVDEALEELPADLRDFLVLHYLKGQSMTEIAAAKGLSQPTVSRRVTAALEQLRQHLRARDVVVSLTGLAVMLANSAQAAPPAVLDALGKMALTQAASTGSSPASASLGSALGVAYKAALATVAMALLAGAVWLALHRATGKSTPSSAQATVAAPSAARTRSNVPEDQPDAAAKPATGPSAIVQQDKIPAINVPPAGLVNSPLAGAGTTRPGSNGWRTPGAGLQTQGGVATSFGFGGWAAGGGTVGGRGSYTAGTWGFSQQGHPAVMTGNLTGFPGAIPGPRGMPLSGFAGPGVVGARGTISGSGQVGTAGGRSGGPLQAGSGAPLSGAEFRYGYGSAWSYTNGIGSETQRVFSSETRPVPSPRRR